MHFDFIFFYLLQGKHKITYITDKINYYNSLECCFQENHCYIRTYRYTYGINKYKRKITLKIRNKNNYNFRRKKYLHETVSIFKKGKE